MSPALILPALLTCFGLCSLNLQAQYVPYPPPGMPPFGSPTCEHGQCSQAQGFAPSPLPMPMQQGQVQRPYGQFQPSAMMPAEYPASPMMGANASGCPHCQQGAGPMPGPSSSNMAMPSPNYPRNNRGPRGMNGPPPTFASVAPPQARTPVPPNDSHAGHDHTNHNHADHNYADHNRAGHSHANPQFGDHAQDRPRLAGPVLNQPAAPGTAQILQNDSPLMSGGEQLGSIDRGQVLKIVSMQGNWVQLETTWLGKNAWIRKDQVLIPSNPLISDEIAPPAN